MPILLFAAAAGHAAPPELAVPDGQKLVWKVSARGAQIYECRDDGSGPVWTLKAPDAELFDASGSKIGTHFAGPTWAAADGSRVVGSLVAKAAAPDAGDIPWLLVAAASNTGDGVFARVKSIQRLDTRGGQPPTDGCDAEQLSAEVRSNYTATYAFYE